MPVDNSYPIIARMCNLKASQLLHFEKQLRRPSKNNWKAFKRTFEWHSYMSSKAS